MSGLLDAVGFRDFWTEDQIKEVVARKAEHDIKAPYDRYSLHWTLDDRRKEEPRVQSRTRLSDVEPLKANHDYSPSSGVLYFGSRAKGLLFSKNLFQTIDIVDAVRKLVSGADHGK